MIRFNLQDRIDEATNATWKELGLALVGGVVMCGGLAMYITHLGKMNENSGKLKAFGEIKKVAESNINKCDEGIDDIETILKMVENLKKAK